MNINHITRCVALLTMIISLPALAAPPDDFREAKAQAKAKVYFDRNRAGDLYCGCTWSWRGESGGAISSAQARNCGLDQKVLANRAQRTEWEHIMPAWHIGHQRQCWQSGGRENCERNDPQFAQMASDLHNLAPVVGSLNAKRSNYRWGMIQGEPRAFGRCDFEVEDRVAEPPESARGMIARVYLYMSDRYGLRLSRQQRQLMTAWHKTYPVTAWERERDRRIAGVMGWGNPYVNGQTPSWGAQKPVSAPVVRESTASRKPILGNKRSKIYHLPNGCPSYGKAADHNEVPFGSESAAQAAGYRKAKNCR